MEPEDIKSETPVRSRRRAREAVLQALYMLELNDLTPDEALADTLERENFAPEAQEFITDTLLGITRRYRTLDLRIAPLMIGWDYHRIAIIDKCLLRMACFELYHSEAIPPKATINEAVVLAKLYGNEESGRFVNGVLAKLFESSPKANWDDLLYDPLPLESDVEEAAEPVEEKIEEGSPEFKELEQSSSAWILKSGGKPRRPQEAGAE